MLSHAAPRPLQAFPSPQTEQQLKAVQEFSTAIVSALQAGADATNEFYYWYLTTAAQPEDVAILDVQVELPVRKGLREGIPTFSFLQGYMLAGLQ